eukprot:1161224-Pelagomonas_calceolata.AAC.5
MASMRPLTALRNLSTLVVLAKRRRFSTGSRESSGKAGEQDQCARCSASSSHTCAMCRVGQFHIEALYMSAFWQGKNDFYGGSMWQWPTLAMCDWMDDIFNHANQVQHWLQGQLRKGCFAELQQRAAPDLRNV